MEEYENFLKSLTGRKRNQKWGIAKLNALYDLFKNTALRVPDVEPLTQTNLYVVQDGLRSCILHMCGKSVFHAGYDSNRQDLIWQHNRWINGLMFKAVAKIVVCCGGRITGQY